MAAHSSILTGIIPQTEELGRLQAMGVSESDTTEHASHHIMGLNIFNQYFYKLDPDGNKTRICKIEIR